MTYDGPLAETAGDTRDSDTMLTRPVARLTMEKIPDRRGRQSMANDRIRGSLATGGCTPPGFAEAVGVDPNTVERLVAKERAPIY